MRALLRRVAPGPPRDDAAAERQRQGEIAHLLERLSEGEADPDQRSTFLVELAECRLRRGEQGPAERALIEAVASSPGSGRAFTRLAALYRRPSGEDAVGYARALNAVIGLGEEAGHLDARWFAALGQLEVHALSRPGEGIPHLRQAVKLDPRLHETRFELASALAAGGANEEAARVLVEMMALRPRTRSPSSRSPDPVVALALLERALGAERRGDEAIVVSELLSLAGEVEETRLDWLRARRVSPTEGVTLDRAAIASRVFSAPADHVLRDVSRAIAGIEGKVLRAGASGSSGSRRETGSGRVAVTRCARCSPLDRLARQLGVGDVELTPCRPRPIARASSSSTTRGWSSPLLLATQPEPRILASLARAVARIALGMPWLGELPMLHAQALLVGAARHVAPSYAPDLEPDAAKLAVQYTAAVARAVGRKNRKSALEELTARPSKPSPAGRPSLALRGFSRRAPPGRGAHGLSRHRRLPLPLPGPRGLRQRRCERPWRRPAPEALALVLQHPIASDLARFALTPEASALRRRVGASWSR